MAVKDWQNGARVWGELVAVREVQIRPRGPKGPQLTATVFDASGARTAKSWEMPPSQVDILVNAAGTHPPLVRVSGTVDSTGAYAGELTLCGVTPAEPGEGAPEDFLEPLPPDHEQLVAGLDRIIQLIHDPRLAELLSKTIGPEGKFRAAYTTASAAKTNHHCEAGGLLRHSLEVTEVALHAGRRYAGVRCDLLIAAGLLHDFGKLWEMDHGFQRGEYTDAGNLIGHVFLGAERISALCRVLKFPEELREALIHAVLAHHDELQYGSPVRPMTQEAILIAKCDQISAEMDSISRAAKTPNGQRMLWRGDRRFFVAGITDADINVPPVVPLPEDPEERLLRRMSEREHRKEVFGTTCLPILGLVAAGDGVRSSEESNDVEERDVIPPSGGADFLLRVTGDSMTGAGILPGDLLVVRSQPVAKVGQIVVAFIPGSGPVVKILAEENGVRLLRSENAEYAPISVSDEVKIQGVVVRVERDL